MLTLSRLQWSNKLTFGRELPYLFIDPLGDDRKPVCFVSMIPLARMLDWGGDQLALYCGKNLGDLMTVTLNK
jgi:hypothetical protein